MTSSSRTSSKPSFKSRSPPEKWISETEDPNAKNIFLRFPDATVRNHSTSQDGELKIAIYASMTSLDAIQNITHFPELDMPAVSEYSIKNLEAGDVIKENCQPSLCFPPHHSRSSFIPKPSSACLIKQGKTRWGSNIICRGEVQYLCGFWEWTDMTHQKLSSNKKYHELVLPVLAAKYDYHRPNGMYRALCELWCTETNTFLTSLGEVGISMWEMRNITGLSISGQYYEEVVPHLSELHDSLPKTCLFLFKAFSIIADEKHNDRIKHADWLNFWFRHDQCKPNPRTSQKYKTIMESPKFNSEGFTKIKITRPFTPESRPMASVGVEEDDSAFTYLRNNMEKAEWEELEIAAYLVLWLCRFTFPSKDDYIRPGTFKVASRMAAGTIYSLVPPILASIYRGLSMTFNPTPKNKNPDLGLSTHTFPGHFLYAWAGLYFPRGVYVNVDRDLPSPTIRRFQGTLNAWQSWELNLPDCRAIVRGSMSQTEFCWNSIPHLPQPGVRHDDGFRSVETSQFLMSIRPGYLSYRRGMTCVLELYSPHRFSRQHGFLQRLPGTPIPPPFQTNPTTLFRAWLSLTRIKSRTEFHIPAICNLIDRQVDKNYSTWWKNDVLPVLDDIPCDLLAKSECSDFVAQPLGNMGQSSMGSKVASSKLIPSPQKRGHSSTITNVSAQPSKKIKIKMSSPRQQPPIAKICSPASGKIQEKGKKNPKRVAVSKVKQMEMPSNRKSSSPVKGNTSTPTNLEMSPKSRNAAFPTVPDLKYLMHGTDINQDLDKVAIDALEGIIDENIPDYVGGGVISSDDEEVNSGNRTSDVPETGHEAVTSFRVSKNAPSTKLTGNSPVFSSMSGRPTESFDSMNCLKSIFLAAMTEYLIKEFNNALKGGFSNMKEWWNSHSKDISENLVSYFWVAPDPLMEKMETFLEKVNAYLIRRQENIQFLSAEERDRNLTSFEVKISVGQLKVKTLAEELSTTKEDLKKMDTKIEDLHQQLRLLQQSRGDLASKLDCLCDHQQEVNEELSRLEKEKALLQNSQVRDPGAVEAVDQMRIELERDLMKMASNEWAKQTL